MRTDMRVVFMGTPKFAVTILRSLVDAGHEIVAVYTKKDSEVAEMARGSFSVRELGTWRSYTVEDNADVAVVAAYGLMIPATVMARFKYGCINVHPSILPKWRGAAPVERAIMAGDKITGVTIMQLDSGLDTGDILRAQTTEIAEHETGEELSYRLAIMGAAILEEVLQNIDNIVPIKQDEALATYAAKISPKEESIDWNDPGNVLECKIRALSPKPGVYIHINDTRLKIISARFERATHELVPGTIFDENMRIAVLDGFLAPKEVQRAGGKKLSVEDFLRGFKVSPGMMAL